MGSLQTSFFMVLGRIFDQDSKHNIDKLVKTAQENREIFSKGALAKRKTEQSNNADEWIDDYLKSVYEPTAKDFRELRKKVKEFREVRGSGLSFCHSCQFLIPPWLAVYWLNCGWKKERPLSL